MLSEEERERIKKTYRAFVDLVQRADSETRAELVRLVTVEEHRTGQQMLMNRFIYPLLKAWGRKFATGEFDGRNKATVTFAAEATQRDYSFPLI